MRRQVLKSLFKSIKETQSLWSKLKTYRVIFLFIAYIPVSLLARDNTRFSNVDGQDLFILPGNTHCVLLNGEEYEVWPLLASNNETTFEIESVASEEWEYFHDALKDYEIELANND